MAQLDIYRSVFLKTLWERRRAFLWWALGSGLMTFWLITLYPEMSQMGELNAFIEMMPESYAVLIGDLADFGTLDGFLSLYLTGLWLPVMVIIIGVSFGGQFIAGEEESNSLDLLLSQPLPRWRLVVEKVAAYLAFITLLMLVNYGAIWLGLVVVDVDPEGVRLLEGIVFSVLPLGLFFTAIVICITGLRRGKALATGVAAGLAGITYLLNNLQQTANLPEWTLNLSPWHYSGGDTVLTDGIQWGSYIGLTLAAVLLVAIGTWGFSQRDLGA